MLLGLEGFSHRAMMGEYILYYHGKVFGGAMILIKPTKSAIKMLPDADMEITYEGTKEMLLVDTEDRTLIKNMVEAMYDERPKPQKKS